MPVKRPPHPDPEIEAAREHKRELRRRYYKRHPGRARAQRKRYARKNKAKVAASRLTEDLICPQCEKPFRGRKGQITCSKRCNMTRALATGRVVPVPRPGPDHPYWKGGRNVTSRGYVFTWVPPGTPGRHKQTGRMAEHRLVMQEHLGRPLKSTEHIHHRNGIKDDNRIENLEIMTKTPHRGVVECPHCGKDFTIR